MQVIPVFWRFGRNRVGIVVRIWGLGGLAVAIWLLSVFGQSRPDALGLGAPATAFSAAAYAVAWVTVVVRRGTLSLQYALRDDAAG